MSVRTSARRAARRAPAPRWTPPEWGSFMERREDGAIFTVTGIYRRDRQVRLESSRLQERHYVGAADLETDWRPAV
jgi:hypothetical protein